MFVAKRKILFSAVMGCFYNDVIFGLYGFLDTNTTTTDVSIYVIVSYITREKDSDREPHIQVYYCIQGNIGTRMMITTILIRLPGTIGYVQHNNYKNIHNITFIWIE